MKLVSLIKRTADFLRNMTHSRRNLLAAAAAGIFLLLAFYGGDRADFSISPPHLPEGSAPWTTPVDAAHGGAHVTTATLRVWGFDVLTLSPSTQTVAPGDATSYTVQVQSKGPVGGEWGGTMTFGTPTKAPNEASITLGLSQGSIVLSSGTTNSTTSLSASTTGATPQASYTLTVPGSASSAEGVFPDSGTGTLSVSNSAPVATPGAQTSGPLCGIKPLAYTFNWVYNDAENQDEDRWDFEVDVAPGTWPLTAVAVDRCYGTGETNDSGAACIVGGLKQEVDAADGHPGGGSLHLDESQTVTVCSQTSSCPEAVSPPNGINYGISYVFRVRGKDSLGATGAWGASSSFSTLSHEIPNATFDCSFDQATWVACNSLCPAVSANCAAIGKVKTGTTVYFRSTATAFGGSPPYIIDQRDWEFRRVSDNALLKSAANVMITDFTYTEAGSYKAIHFVSDNSGDLGGTVCNNDQQGATTIINTRFPSPEWREVSP